MADPKGFMTTPRRVAARRPVAERIHDWKEVYPGSPGRAVLPIISEQAGRCMDCGIPFCHTGCPLGNLIPEWNDLVWRSDWDEALERLHATNNFPEFTGRLCPAPCETACVVGINRDPVTIKNVEDEMMVAMLIEDMLDELGYSIVGPFAHIDEALEAARELQFDAALLDFNLNGKNTYPVAWTLRERNIPFLFATGYGSSILNSNFMGIPLLQKPFQQRDLAWALRRAVQQ